MVRIPKRVGAVKLPKKIRKKAKKAIKRASSPFVRDFASAAMAAAGRARRSDRVAGDEQEQEDYRMCTRIDIEGSKVAEAFRTAAIDGLRRFLEGFEEGLRKAQAEESAEKDDPQPEPRAAPRPRAPAKPKAKPRKPRASGPAPGAA